MKISKAEARDVGAQGRPPSRTAVRESAGERSPGTVRPPGSLTTPRAKNAKPGSRWRLLAWDQDARGNDTTRVALSSDDQPSIFDELVVWLGDEVIHVEQMDARTWFVGLGKEKRMVRVKRDGTLEIGEVYF